MRGASSTGTERNPLPRISQPWPAPVCTGHQLPYLQQEGFGLGASLFGPIKLHFSLPRGVKKTKASIQHSYETATYLQAQQLLLAKALYLSSKAASSRASRMFSSGSQVLYLGGHREREWHEDPETEKINKIKNTGHKGKDSSFLCTTMECRAAVSHLLPAPAAEPYGQTADLLLRPALPFYEIFHAPLQMQREK